MRAVGGKSEGWETEMKEEKNDWAIVLQGFTGSRNLLSWFQGDVDHHVVRKRLQSRPNLFEAGLGR